MDRPTPCSSSTSASPTSANIAPWRRNACSWRPTILMMSRNSGSPNCRTMTARHPGAISRIFSTCGSGPLSAQRQCSSSPSAAARALWRNTPTASRPSFRHGRLEEAQRVQLYTDGLLPPLSHVVRLHHPETLAAAMSLVRQVELMEQSRPVSTLPRAPQRGLLVISTPRPALPAPQQALALPAPLAANQQGRAEGNIRRLSKDEMAERRRQGLCFNCNEPYTRGHNRFRKRLFFVDGVEVDDAEDTVDTGEKAAGTDAPCYSLHAVAGVRLSDTLRVRVVVGSVSLVALLDSGSSHNFISERAGHVRYPVLQETPRPRHTQGDRARAGQAQRVAGGRRPTD